MQSRQLISIFLLVTIPIKASEEKTPSRVPSLKKLCLTAVKREYRYKGHLVREYAQALQDIVGLEKDHDTRVEWIEVLNFVRSPDLQRAIECVAQKPIFAQRDKQNRMPVEAGQVLAWVQYINETQQLPESVASRIWTKRNQQYTVTSTFS